LAAKAAELIEIARNATSAAQVHAVIAEFDVREAKLQAILDDPQGRNPVSYTGRIKHVRANREAARAFLAAFGPVPAAPAVPAAPTAPSGDAKVAAQVYAFVKGAPTQKAAFDLIRAIRAENG
jgi:hypothetical protein